MTAHLTPLGRSRWSGDGAADSAAARACGRRGKGGKGGRRGSSGRGRAPVGDARCGFDPIADRDGAGGRYAVVKARRSGRSGHGRGRRGRCRTRRQDPATLCTTWRNEPPGNSAPMWESPAASDAWAGSRELAARKEAPASRKECRSTSPPAAARKSSRDRFMRYRLW